MVVVASARGALVQQYLGVSLAPDPIAGVTTRFDARATISGREVHLGTYVTATAAAEAHDCALLAVHGAEWAASSGRLNFPARRYRAQRVAAFAAARGLQHHPSWQGRRGRQPAQPPQQQPTGPGGVPAPGGRAAAEAAAAAAAPEQQPANAAAAAARGSLEPGTQLPRYLGVRPQESGRFGVHVRVATGRIWLGVHDSASAAARVRDCGVLAIQGRAWAATARNLNFPAHSYTAQQIRQVAAARNLRLHSSWGAEGPVALSLPAQPRSSGLQPQGSRQPQQQPPRQADVQQPPRQADAQQQPRQADAQQQPRQADAQQQPPQQADVQQQLKQEVKQEVKQEQQQQQQPQPGMHAPLALPAPAVPPTAATAQVGAPAPPPPLAAWQQLKLQPTDSACEAIITLERLAYLMARAGAIERQLYQRLQLALPGMLDAGEEGGSMRQAALLARYSHLRMVHRHRQWEVVPQLLELLTGQRPQGGGS